MITLGLEGAAGGGGGTPAHHYDCAAEADNSISDCTIPSGSDLYLFGFESGYDHGSYTISDQTWNGVSDTERDVHVNSGVSGGVYIGTIDDPATGNQTFATTNSSSPSLGQNTAFIVASGISNGSVSVGTSTEDTDGALTITITSEVGDFCVAAAWTYSEGNTTAAVSCNHTEGPELADNGNNPDLWTCWTIATGTSTTFTWTGGADDTAVVGVCAN